MNEWIIGVLLSIIASASASLGDNLIKWSYNQHEINAYIMTEREDKMVRFSWFLGNFLNIIVNTALVFFSFSFADASLIVPLGSLHIFFNLPLSWFINNEYPTKFLLVCNFLIILGVVIVLLGSNHMTVNFTTNDLIRQLKGPEFIVFTILIIICISLCLFLMLHSKVSNTRRLCSCLLTGLVGSITQVLTKATSECILNAEKFSLFTFICIILTITSASVLLFLLNSNLKHFLASYVVPTVNATIIVVGSIYGSFYFSENHRWDITGKIIVPFGISLSAIGVAFLAKSDSYHVVPSSSHQDNSLNLKMNLTKNSVLNSYSTSIIYEEK